MDHCRSCIDWTGIGCIVFWDLVRVKREGNNMHFYTDYPILELGDEPHKPAPVRECTILRYDGDKYCDVVVEGIKTNFKAGYIYTKRGRYAEVPSISYKELKSFEE